MAVGSSLVPSSQSLLGGLSLTTHVFILGTLLALVLPILFVLYKILSFLFRILQRLGRLGSWIIGRRERLAPADSAAALSRQTTGAENVDDSAASKVRICPRAFISLVRYICVESRHISIGKMYERDMPTLC